MFLPSFIFFAVEDSLRMLSKTFNTWNDKYIGLLSACMTCWPLSPIWGIKVIGVPIDWDLAVSRVKQSPASHSQNVWFDSPAEQECRHWVVFIWKTCEECFLTKFPNEMWNLISSRVKAGQYKQSGLGGSVDGRWQSGYVTRSMTEFPIARLYSRYLGNHLTWQDTPCSQSILAQPLTFSTFILSARQSCVMCNV